MTDDQGTTRSDGGTGGWFHRAEARDWDHVTSSPSARAFHESLPGYAPTPLVSLPELATELGVRAVLLKDESSRLGLPAFKILGASWAIARMISERTGATTDLDELHRAVVGSGLRLVTATDGNHGRAVAHMASLLGLTATVFVPAVMTTATADAIATEGADVVRVDGDYDAAVATARRFAEEHSDRALVQDMGWDGYEQIPAWTVEGYDTMLEEIDEQLAVAPDLVAIPVGVGSLAHAVVAHYRRPGSPHPVLLSVEPDTASCLLGSLVADLPVIVTTGATVMAGLNCGTVSTSAWPVLRAGCDAAVSVPDADALRAVNDLGRLDVSSGPSGAATLAGVRAAVADPTDEPALGIDETSTLVLLSTEGAAE